MNVVEYMFIAWRFNEDTFLLLVTDINNSGGQNNYFQCLQNGKIEMNHSAQPNYYYFLFFMWTSHESLFLGLFKGLNLSFPE